MLDRQLAIPCILLFLFGLSNEEYNFALKQCEK